MIRTFAVQFLKAGKVVKTVYMTAFTEVSAKIAAMRNAGLPADAWDDAEATPL